MSDRSGSLLEPGLARRLVANTLHAASGRIAAILVWVVFTPAILDALGPAGFGVWSLFYALTGYLATLDFGLVQATLRHVAAARGRGADDEAGAFATLGVIGYLALGSVWLIATAALHGPALHWLRVPAELMGSARFAILLGAPVFALCGIANVLMAVAQGYGRFDLANRLVLAISAAQALGFVIVLRRGWGLEGLIMSAGLGWALGCVAGFAILRGALPALRWQSPRASLARMGDVLRFGGPMQLTNLMAALNLHVDKLLLSRFVSLATVAPYELGSRVATAASTLPQLILLAVLPEAAALHEAGRSDRLRELYDRGSRYALTALAVVLAPLLACADRLYATWLGPGHADASLALRALTISVGISLSAGMGATLARAIARTDLEAWWAAVTMSLHLALSLWLIPRMGLTGALIAMPVATLVGLALFEARLGRALRWPLWSVVVRPCAVPLLAVAAGAALGAGCDRVLPTATGALAWALLAVAATVASAGALAVTLLTRYLSWREVQSLLTGAR